jgi:hypothetical protein
MASTVPLLMGLLSTNCRAVGAALGSNSRLPVPSTIGSMNTRYSSMRPLACNVWARLALPWTWISPAYWSLSLVTSALTSPRTIVVGCQSARFSVVETTYLGRVLSLDATGSSWSGKLGQLPAKIS